MKRKKKQKTN